MPYFVRNQTLSSAFWARERNNLPAEQNIFTNELISGGECDRVVRAFEYRTRKSTFAAIHSSYFLKLFLQLKCYPKFYVFDDDTICKRVSFASICEKRVYM